ncbi:hypothetical protein [Halococcus sp. PRR34]|uniref:hypothetical protein n=1 Tax=Halococcus sp. PRR34 TaxID=3020830 RepID=UPI00235EB5D7|nr:hypothetical protein [Halococcus sp. PRR34]
MAELNEDVFAAARQRGRTLLTEELVALIERHHPHDRPGIERDIVTRYADGLDTDERSSSSSRDGGPDDDGTSFDFDRDAFLDEVDARLADTETWQGTDALYAPEDDRVSRYPARWHDALGGSTDVREFVVFLLEETDGYLDDLESGGAGRGIPEDELLDVVSVVGRTDRETAKARVESGRKAGDLVEDADQHPEARVRPRE